MPCDHAPMPGGGHAIVCSRGRRRPRCSVCGEPGADRECDYPVKPRRGRYGIREISSTCDRALHRRCATVEGEHDYCPHHPATGRQLSLPGWADPTIDADTVANIPIPSES